MKPESKKPITLEDLLRLKRVERPPAEFWAEFERELRVKQLAAIVARRPWWQTWPRKGFSSFARYHLPLGATAVLALTFVSLREYRSPHVQQPLEIAPMIAESAAVAAIPVSPRETISIDEPAPVAVETLVAPPTETLATVPLLSEETVLTNVSPPAPADSDTFSRSAMNALLGMPALAQAEGELSLQTGLLPEQRSLAAREPGLQLAALPQAHGFESRALPARAIEEPLAKVTPPSTQSRRPRYIDGSARTVSVAHTISGRSSEHRVRTISDERLYETISRYGFGADQVTLKF